MRRCLLMPMTSSGCAVPAWCWSVSGPAAPRASSSMTLEDETGHCQHRVWPKVMEKFRKEVMGARLIEVQGDHSEQPGQGGPSGGRASVRPLTRPDESRQRRAWTETSDPCRCGYHRATGRRTEGAFGQPCSQNTPSAQCPYSSTLAGFSLIRFVNCAGLHHPHQ